MRAIWYSGIMLSVVISAVSVNAQDFKDFNAQFQKEAIALRIKIYEVEAAEIDLRLSMFEFVETLLPVLKKIPQELRNEETKEEAQRFLKDAERALDLYWPGFPEIYPQEVFPLLFGQINNRRPPKDSTEVQKRILEARKEGFDAMLDAISQLVAEDKRLPLKQRAAILKKIDALEKELQK